MLFSACLAGALAALLRGVTLRAAALLCGIWIASGVSHAVLDALTDGGLGVMMFYPFSESRFFFPWQPLRVSPIGLQGFLRGWGPVVLSELPVCVIAMALGWLGYRCNSSARL